MLALKSCEYVSGLSVMTADELYYVNGGSGGGNSYNVNLPSYSSTNKNGWSLSNGGVTYTSGNKSVTISGNLKPTVKITFTFKF